jgi:hypothetical protein
MVSARKIGGVKNNPHYNKRRAEAEEHRRMAVHNFLVALLYRRTPPDHPDYAAAQKAAQYSLYEARARVMEGRRVADLADPVVFGATRERG